MRIKTTIVVFIVGITMSLQSCKTPTYGEEVTAVSSSVSTAGVLFVKSWVVSSRKKRDFMAMQNALERILFQGVPNSSVTRPLVNNPQAKALHRAYFDKLLTDPETMSTYVSVLGANAKDIVKLSNGCIKRGVNCEVRYKALQADLERNGIIAKFGI